MRNTKAIMQSPNLSTRVKIKYSSIRNLLQYLSLQRVTVTRILSRKVCYIAEMDTSLPSPGKLTADLDQVNIIDWG